MVKALAIISRWEFIPLINQICYDMLVKVEVKYTTFDILFLPLLLTFYPFLLFLKVVEMTKLIDWLIFLLLFIFSIIVKIDGLVIIIQVIHSFYIVFSIIARTIQPWVRIRKNKRGLRILHLPCNSPKHRFIAFLALEYFMLKYSSALTGYRSPYSFKWYHWPLYSVMNPS